MRTDIVVKLVCKLSGSCSTARWLTASIADDKPAAIADCHEPTRNGMNPLISQIALQLNCTGVDIKSSQAAFKNAGAIIRRLHPLNDVCDLQQVHHL